MKNRIRIARGTSAELGQSTAKAELGVPFYDTTNKRLYISTDPNKELKDYGPDDSIIAYRATKGILNTDNNTYSGFTQDNNNILKVDDTEIVSKKKLIWSGDVYVEINNNALTGGTIANLPFTFENGKIYEVQGYFETPMSSEWTTTYQWKTTCCSPTYQGSENIGTYTMGVSSLWGNFSMDGTAALMVHEIHTCEIEFFYSTNPDTGLAQHDVSISSSFPYCYVTSNNIQTDVNPKFPYMVVSSKIGITRVFEIIE